MAARIFFLQIQFPSIFSVNEISIPPVLHVPYGNQGSHELRTISLMIANYNGCYIQPCNLQLLHKKPFRLLFLSQGESENLRIIFFSRPSLKRSQQSALSRNSTLIKFVLSTCTYYNHFLTWHRQREEESEKNDKVLFSQICALADHNKSQERFFFPAEIKF